MNTADLAGAVAVLFTDIEGSTRLWEESPEQMRPALERHNALARTAIEGHGGTVVKSTGDGVYAVFQDPGDAVWATLNMQLGLAAQNAASPVELRVRYGLHLGVVDRFDNDFFGNVVNRSARIMSAAHGGQILLSQAMATAVRERLPVGVTLRDLGSARLRDLAKPERLYQVVHAQLRQEFPALRSLEATPNNLPQQLTPFIGRERDLAEARRVLTNTRLLTLLGVGGIGKTRLSLQVAAEVIDDYSDGVWFVELAALADARLVAPAVASVLGVQVEGGRPIVEALVKHVKDRRLLLVLDNCEHLLSSCAELAKQLLRSGANVKLLASSREALHMAGETSYHVPTLTAPDPNSRVGLTSLAQYEAIRLFVGRASAAQPKFQLSHQNAAAVAEICHRLDGIPLALELAAARVRALSVENIAARLGDRFRLLTGGDQTALPRQQTLRTSIDWSHELLSEPERLLFLRLSVFAGGWTLEAAEAVGAGGELEQSQVLDLLAQLVEKSLVESEADGQRYRMLETVRQYAQSRLQDSREEKQLRTRHLAFFVAFAEEAALRLYGPAQVEWIARLDLERENLLSAHEWCDRVEGGVELGLRLVSSVFRYWVQHGPLELGLRVTTQALGRVGAREHGVASCRALLAAAGLNRMLGRHEEEYAYGREALAVARETGDKRILANALWPLALVSGMPDGLAKHRQYAEEALELSRELGDNVLRGHSLNTLVAVLSVLGEPASLEPLLAESLEIYRESGDRTTIAIVLFNLAELSMARGSPQGSRGWLLEAIGIAQETRSKKLELQALILATQLATYLRDWVRAARLYGACEVHAEETGLEIEFAGPDEARPERARDALGSAAFTAALEKGRLLDSKNAVEEARAWLEESRAPEIS